MKQKLIAFIFGLGLLLFAGIATLMLAERAHAKEPETTTGTLSVACVSEKKIKEIVEGNFDTMLLRGQSKANGFPVVILYNRSAKVYTILMQAGVDNFCIIDYGRGIAAMLKEHI